MLFSREEEIHNCSLQARVLGRLPLAGVRLPFLISRSTGSWGSILVSLSWLVDLMKQQGQFPLSRLFCLDNLLVTKGTCSLSKPRLSEQGVLLSSPRPPSPGPPHTPHLGFRMCWANCKDAAAPFCCFQSGPCGEVKKRRAAPSPRAAPAQCGKATLSLTVSPSVYPALLAVPWYRQSCTCTHVAQCPRGLKCH